MHLSYNKLEDLLAGLHDVDASKRAALRARFKHFQRLGWPEGANLGKGRRVQYSLPQVLGIVVGFELLQFGLTPERAVTMLRRMQGLLPAGFLTGLNMDVENPSHSYIVFDPGALRGLRDDPAEEEIHWGAQTMWLSTTQGVTRLICDQNWAMEHPRQALLNLSAVITHVQSGLRRVQPTPESEIEKVLLAWKQEEEGRRDRQLEEQYGHDPEA